MKKALTIKQPWAGLIIEGIKNIENRTWKTNYRGRVYVHAGAKPAPFFNSKDYGMRFTDSQLKEIFKAFPISKYGRYADFMPEWPNSAIIGEVDIIDCVINHPSVWAENNKGLPEDGEIIKPIYNWVLANPVKYDQPILNVKGKLSFWEYNK